MGAMQEYLKSFPSAKPVRRVVKSGGFYSLPALRSPVGCDTETTGLDSWKKDRPFAFSFCDCEGRRAFIRGRVDPTNRDVSHSENDLRELRIFFMNPNIEKVFHNAFFDVRMLGACNIPVRGRIQETMFAMHALNPLEANFKLKRLARVYLEISDVDEKDLRRATSVARRAAEKKGWAIATKQNQRGDPLSADYWLAPPELLQKYAALDAERTIMLWLLAKDKMDEEEVRETYEREMELWPITYGLETRGVRVDVKIVEREIKIHAKALAADRLRLQKMLPNVNPNSPKQLNQFFYGPKSKGGLNLPPQFGKGGGYTCDTKALARIDHPVARVMVKLRLHEKALSSFFLKYRDLSVPDPLNPGGFALHPSFQQSGPATGRYSCRQPNLQNVANALSTRSTEPLQARAPFGPRPGWYWWHFDYSQLEVRIFADVAQEEFMLKAFRTGRDLHTECANKAWGGEGNQRAVASAVHALELDGSASAGHDDLVQAAIGKVSRHRGTLKPEGVALLWLDQFKWNIVKAEATLKKKTSRAKAKMLLFLKIFGGGVPAATDLMDCTPQEARQFLDDYDSAFPTIRQYIEQMSREARCEGFIRNRYNRRLMVDPEKPYRAVNYMVQGSAADLLKDRMVALEKLLRNFRERGIEAWQVLTIHDEIVVEIKVDQTRPWMLRRIRALMEDHGGHFGIPMPVEIACTKRDWSRKVPHKV